MNKEKDLKDFEKFFGNSLDEISKKPMKLYNILIEANKPKEKKKKLAK